MAYQTLIYFKDLSDPSLCTSPHSVPSGLFPSGSQYTVYYNETAANTAGVLPNADIIQIAAANIPIYVDDLSADNSTGSNYADTGNYSSLPFDGSGTSDATIYPYIAGSWGSPTICPYSAGTSGTSGTSTKTLEVFYTSGSPGDYCSSFSLGVIYYDGSVLFSTIEHLIFNFSGVNIKFHQDANLAPDSATITDLTDPLQTGPAGLVDLIAGEFGDLPNEFYQFDGTSWFQANALTTDYNDSISTPLNDPGSTKLSAESAGWLAFECLNMVGQPVNLLYGADENSFCTSATLATYYYFTGPSGPSYNLIEDLTSNNIKIFTTAEDAVLNFYDPTHITNITSNGLYSTDAAYYYPWIRLTQTWGTTQSFCPVDPSVRSINIRVAGCSDYAEIVSLCHYPTNEVTVYYKDSVNRTLLDIVRNNIYLYNTSSAANTEDFNELIEYGAIKPGTLDTSIPADEYFIWTGSFYLGKDSIGNVVSSTGLGAAGITNGYECQELIRPGKFNTEVLNTGGYKVYYAFFKCGPITINQAPTSFPVYIIDGDHSINDTNYISDFIDNLKNTSKLVFSNKGACNCVEYIHKILANTDQEAQILLENYYDSVLVVNPSLIGITSLGTVSTYETCDDCYDQVDGDIYTFPFVEDEIPEETGPNFNLEQNYNLDNNSKPLLRTNPKLSTNVKLVVDGDNRIYLDSISANNTLSSSRYKRYELSPDSKYSFDLARYYNDNQTPIESVFEVKREYSDLSVLDDYSKQFEEEYHYGTKLNTSKLYSEDYRLSAPLWLDINVPKKFVIYRVDNPIPADDFSDTSTGKLSRIVKMMQNASIVKVFDLTTSPVGRYLRRHVQDEFFPQTPITYTMEKDEKSTYNGIDLLKGGFVQKAENVYEDFVQKDSTLIDANDFITDGFRRNKVACANLINLEFMFNDPNSTDYSINRYFGLYVDELDSGVGEISYVKNGLVKFKSIESYLQGQDPTFAIPEYRLLQSAGVLAYVKIRDSYYNLDSAKSYLASRFTMSIKAEDSEINSKLGIATSGKSIDITQNKDAGSDYIKLKVIANPATGDTIRVSKVKRESVRLKIIKNVNSEIVNISDSLGNYIEFSMGVTSNDSWESLKNVWETIDSLSPVETQSFYERYEIDFEGEGSLVSVVIKERFANLIDNQITVTSTNSIISNKEIYTNPDPNIGIFSADSTGSIAGKTFNQYVFSGSGILEDVAFSISGIINTYTEFTSFYKDNYVYIKNDVNGYRLMNSVFLNQSTNSNFLEFENVDLNNELKLSTDILGIYDSYYFNGGHSSEKSVLIPSNIRSEVNPGDFIPTKYRDTYNEVLDVVENTDTSLSTGYKLILKTKNTLTNGNYEVYNNSRMSIGLFSAYDIHDMNFDFYDTSNSDLKELKYETVENIGYEPYDDSIAETPVGELGPENTISNDFSLNPIDYFGNLLPVLGGEQVSNIQTEKILSEFDRLKENQLKEYAINSRVVPSINKWVLKDTFTVREQPYYLNTNEALGKTNFSPDITIEGRDRNGFTHEWFYLDKWPGYFEYDMYNDGFSYVDFAYDFETTKSLFKDTVHNYFNLFMVSDGHEVLVPFENPGDPSQNKETVFYTKTELRKKYTLINGGNDSRFASTIFKGLKFEFKKRKEVNSTITTEFVKNSEFNGYKFSTLVKVNTDAGTNTINYEFIKNDKFKFIVLFIELNIDDLFVSGSLNRKLLYELQHKIVFSLGSYQYADVDINGAIEVSSINWAAPGPYILTGVQHNDGTSSLFTQQISPTSDGSYGRIKIDYGFTDPYYLDVVTVLGDDKIQVSGVPYYFDSLNAGIKTLSNPYTIPINTQKNAIYVYEEGGVNAHQVLLEKLSANNFVQTLNTNPEDITFTTIDINGVESVNKYGVSVDDGKEIIKKSRLAPFVDTDTPKSYKLKKETIGFVIDEINEYYPFLIRHSGNYTVDTRPVITFTDIYSFNKVNRDHREYDPDFKSLKEQVYKLNLSVNYEVNKAAAFYKRYNRMGVAFNVGFISDGGSHDSNWGMIRNHFYHKVNEINTLGVTKLSETTEYPPLYPLINEIAIDKRDINVFKSPWENNYYVRSKSSGEKDFVPGTLSTLEEKSYLGSSVIKYKPSYSIFEFTSSSVNNESELDVILRSESNPTDIVFFEDENRIIADFYMIDIVSRLIGNDGLNKVIEKWVTPENSAGDKTTVSDDIILYAKNNMVGLYGLNQIEIYSTEYKGSPSQFNNPTSLDLIDNGFNRYQDFTYQTHGQKPLNFRLIYNKKLGYSYSIRTLIKIQA